MADSGPVGSVAGGMAEMQLNLQNIQLNQYKLQEAPIKVEQERIELTKDRMDLQKQVKMLSLMQNIAPPKDVGTPEGIAGVLNQIAVDYAESGMPDAAAKTAVESMSILDKASEVEERSYEMQSDRLGRFVGVLGAVKDSPEGFAAAVQTMMSDPGAARDPRFRSVVQRGWYKGVIPALRASAITEKDRVEAVFKLKSAERAEAAADLDRAKIPLIQAKVKRELDIEKEGGVVVKPADHNLILKMARADHPDADPNDLYWRSYGVAEQMLRMRREQHLSEGEAAKRAYKQSIDNKEWEGLRKGGTKNQQSMVNAQANVIDQIDHMVTTLDTLGKDPTGWKGKGHALLEHVGGLTGDFVGEKGSAANRFATDAEALQTTLLAALTPGRYRSKDIQTLMAELADVRGFGMDRKTAKGKLLELKSLVQAEMDKSGIKPVGEQQAQADEPIRYEPDMEERYQKWKKEQEDDADLE